MRDTLSKGIGWLIAAALTSSAQAEIAATHIYHNHMPNFWPYYNVASYDATAPGQPIRYAYDGDVIELKKSPPNGYNFFLPSGAAMPHDDLISYYSHHGKIGAYLDWPWQTAEDNAKDFSLSQTHVTMSGAVVNNVQSLIAHKNVSGYDRADWGQPWRNTYSKLKTKGGFRALDLIHFTGHHSMGPLVGDNYFLKDLIFHNATLAQNYFLGEKFTSSKGFFPTELGFSERLIPTLRKLGVGWSVVGNVHFSRTLADYPYLNDPGIDTMVSPPNRADLQNESTTGAWKALNMFNEKQVTHNKFPFASIPHWVRYVDPETGAESKLAGIPVEQAASWEEGYQGSVTAAAIKPFDDAANGLKRTQYFVVAHDGDNSQGRAGDGGTWANSGNVTYADPGVTGMGVDEYLRAHPIPADDVVHVQDGSWIDTRDSSADPTWYHWHLPFGIWKPQFADFNRVTGLNLSPKKNLDGAIEPFTVSLEHGYHYLERNFALLQAAENYAKTAEQIWLDDHPQHWSPKTPLDKEVTYPGNQLNPWMISFPIKGDANRDYAGGANPAELAWYFLLPALDSGFGYYDENIDDGVKPTLAFNQSLHFSEPFVKNLRNKDRTGPSVWWPQRWPYNPGSANVGKAEGWTKHYFDNTFALYTYAFDVNDVSAIKARVRVHKNTRIKATDNTPLVYEPARLKSAGISNLTPSNVGEWVDYPLTKRSLQNVINGVDWQATGQKMMKIVPAQKIGDLYYVYLNDYRDQMLDYYIEATDNNGNTTKTDIQHVYVGAGKYRKEGGKIVEDAHGDITGTRPFIAANAPEQPSHAVEIYIQSDDAQSRVQYRNAGGSWSNAPVPTKAPMPGYQFTQFSYQSKEDALVVQVRDGSGIWPEFPLGAGVWTLSRNKPPVHHAPPCDQCKVAIYYKSSAPIANIHYRSKGGAWTTPPGIAMARSNIDGYYAITLPTDGGGEIEAAFNDGVGHWDNSGGNNYLFAIGASTLADGKIIPGAPIPLKSNTPPIAVISNSITILAGDTAHFDASQSYDDDGTIVSYEWSNGLSGAQAARVYATVGVFPVTLTIKDNQGATAQAIVTVTVTVTVTPKPTKPGSQAPIANAGQDYSITIGDSVLLDGSGSFDPDGKIMRYEWSTGSLARQANWEPAFPGEYTITLLVIDDSGMTSSDTTKITVKPRKADPADGNVDGGSTDAEIEHDLSGAGAFDNSSLVCIIVFAMATWLKRRHHIRIVAFGRR